MAASCQSASPSPAPASAAGCATAAAPASPTAPAVSLGEADRNRTVTVQLEEVLVLNLSGAPWTAVCSSDPAVLTPLYGSHGNGTTSGAFRAARPGTAQLVTTTAAAAAGTGKPVERFSVTVEVGA
jgi:hypothetical protein